MKKEESSIDALELVRKNYKDYAIYVANGGRAYCGLYDGLKSSYRRALYGIYENKTSKIVKVAELSAHALPYHPHPSSVSGVIIQMGEAGNKLKLFDTQGNWGDSSRGVEASAERYIGGRLSILAEHLLLDSVEYANFVKGEIEKDEPEALPVLLPLCFINGLTGIPTGLPALNIPTIDINGMIDYYIDILSHHDLSYCPKKMPMPNLEIDVISSTKEWENILHTGKGSLKLAPRMTIKNNIITITALPNNKDIDHIRKIIDKEIAQDKLDIRDESTEKICYVVEKVPKKQCDMQDIYKRLYSKLSTSVSYNMAFYDKDKIYVPCSFNKVVRSNLEYLIEVHQRRLANEIIAAQSRLTVLMIIEGLKKRNLVKSLFELDYDSAVSFLVKHFKCTDNDATKVLQKPISYLTKEHQNEIDELETLIKNLNEATENIYEHLIEKYKNIKKELAPIIKNKFEPTVFVNETKPKKKTSKA
jgi:DNA gyrase/topoisomerase IV subunit A